MEASDVRRLVETEGKTARNLVTWSVPAVEQRRARRNGSAGRRKRGRGRGKPRPEQTAALEKQLSEEICHATADHYSHSERSVRSQDLANKADLRARYWSYLFDNLHRAVDEIYCTCEADESVLECQEVLLSLERCKKDFNELIKRIELQRAFENTDTQNRPPSLAWEVRKTTSPNKHQQQQQQQTQAHLAGTAKGRRSQRNSPHPPQVRECRSHSVGPPPGRDSQTQRLPCARPAKTETHTGMSETDTNITGVVKSGSDTVSNGSHIRNETTKNGSQLIRKPDSGTASPGASEIRRTGSRPGSGRTTAKCSLDFSQEDRQRSASTTVISSTALTWADRVRGVHRSASVEENKKEEIVQPKIVAPSNQPLRVSEEQRERSDSGTSGTQGDAQKWSWSDILAEYDAMEGDRRLSWADRCDSPPGGTLPEVPRSPGRAVHLHQRLSSPSRKRPIEESRRILEEKQAKAQIQRSRLQEEKTLRSKVIADKIRDVRESQDARVQQKRQEMEGKLQRAEQLRSSHLQEIVRKAQEEDAKVSEIAFINALEAQNKRIEVMERYHGQEARLQDLKDERQRKIEEQQAREEAAQERRRTMEAERTAKLMEMNQRRKEQDAKIEYMKVERERARDEAAKEKARERERKREARNAAIQLSAEELERRIQIKQDESSRRYDQQLEQKKEKAAVSSRHLSTEDAPRVEAYQTKKWCTICGVRIISEVYLLSHLKGMKHQTALLALDHDPTSVIVEAAEEHQGPEQSRPEVEERLRAGKKRARKLRQRMSSRAREQESKVLQSQLATSPSKIRSKLQKAVRELNRLTDSISSFPQLDKTLGEVGRLLSTKSPEDQWCFCELGGVASLMRLLLLSQAEPQRAFPNKSFQLAVGALESCCQDNTSVCHYLILSNKFSPLIDLLLHSLTAPDSQVSSTFLCSLIATILLTLASSKENASLVALLSDCISYVVSVGAIDKVREHLTTVTGPMATPSEAQLVSALVAMLDGLSGCSQTNAGDIFEDKKDDLTLISTVMSHTELVGLPQLLYTMLLHSGPPRHAPTPPPLPPHTLTIATSAVRVINNAARLNLRSVQACLGAEGISLEFRHIVSYLLWYCSHHQHPSLLHELILAVGYFCVGHHDNQVFLQSGRSPTLLQLLCALPFEYFSSPPLCQLLYPTLISACYHCEENRAILEQEVSARLLVTFLQEHSQSKASVPSSLAQRFPRKNWDGAIDFFSQTR